MRSSFIGGFRGCRAIYKISTAPGEHSESSVQREPDVPTCDRDKGGSDGDDSSALHEVRSGAIFTQDTNVDFLEPGGTGAPGWNGGRGATRHADALRQAAVIPP